MGASLRAGLGALAAAATARRRWSRWSTCPTSTRRSSAGCVASGAGPGALVRATYDGAPGHPVLIGRDHWAGVAATARGDQGARDYLAPTPTRCECGDLATGRDVDQPEDLRPTTRGACERLRRGECWTACSRPGHARIAATSSPSGSATTGYLCDDSLATIGFLALSMQRPLLLEGEPGTGKTALAEALARGARLPLIRLQCYEGIDASQALYDWDFPRQILHLRALEAAGGGAVTDADAAEERCSTSGSCSPRCT